MNDRPDTWSHGVHVVSLGGGTGLANLLRGLKGLLRSRRAPAFTAGLTSAPYISDISAIVAMTDDGGSSGRLRKALGMPPPGDLRNCMVALSDDDDLISHLFQHRFSGCDGELGDHSLGNLCIAALSQMTGDFQEAVELACELLAVCGRILPVTVSNSTLTARMLDGSHLVGETALASCPQEIVEVALDPPNAQASPAALEAIASADLITVGPGSLYTSLITNLLVEGISDAIFHSSATRVYVANLMTQPNESLGFSVSEHIERIYLHSRRPIFDYALVNVGSIADWMLESYSARGGQPVVADLERVERMGIRCVTGDFLGRTDAAVRHNPELLAAALLNLPLLQGRRYRSTSQYRGQQMQ